MHPDVRHTLANKQLLLLQELGELCNYQDFEIYVLISQGCELDGAPKASGVFPRQLVILEVPQEALDKTCSITRRTVIQMTANAKEKDMAAEVWAETVLEQSRGWQAGP